MSKSWKGKSRIVTGASKGIGAGIAKELGAARGGGGRELRRPARTGADRVVEEIVAAGGGRSRCRRTSRSRRTSTRLFAETKAAYGRLDVLVNNAGVYEFAPLAERHRRSTSTGSSTSTCSGLILATQKAAEAFGETGGSVINISSGVAGLTRADRTVYSATKAAVDAITRSLAKELGPRGIRVNSLNPGMVETEGFHTAGIAGGEFEKAVVVQHARSAASASRTTSRRSRSFLASRRRAAG